jgi:hypothetical protein
MSNAQIKIPRATADLEAGLAVIKERWPELQNTCTDDPVFIFAAGWRSGSTLLQRLLRRQDCR